MKVESVLKARGVRMVLDLRAKMRRSIHLLREKLQKLNTETISKTRLFRISLVRLSAAAEMKD